jgi:hypothetical protein
MSLRDGDNRLGGRQTVVNNGPKHPSSIFSAVAVFCLGGGGIRRGHLLATAPQNEPTYKPLLLLETNNTR